VKPLDTYVLRCVDHEAGETGAICSDIVRLLRWEYGRTHEHSVVGKRLSDLRASGLIRRHGQRRSELTKQSQTVYVTTSKGRRLLARLDRQAEKEAS
jgi:hypothetical protein